MLSTYGMVCNILLFTYVAFQPFIKLRFCVNDSHRAARAGVMPQNFEWMMLAGPPSKSSQGMVMIRRTSPLRCLLVQGKRAGRDSETHAASV